MRFFFSFFFASPLPVYFLGLSPKPLSPRELSQTTAAHHDAASLGEISFFL